MPSERLWSLAASIWIPLILLLIGVRPKLLRRMQTTIDDAMDTAGLPLLGVVPEDERRNACGKSR